MAVIAVIGGTGFLGRCVVARLKENGHSPRVLSRRTGFDLLRPNVKDLREVDAVVNLVGIKREDGEQTFHAVHVDAVRRLVETMKAAGVERLIHISVVVARKDPRLPYHHTKWQGEEVVRGSGLNWTILRPGVIYGEGDDLLSHLRLLIQISPVFPIVGDGSAPMRPVDVRDVASSIVASLQRPCNGKVYDVVGPERLYLREVVGNVAIAMGLPLGICPTPALLMLLPVLVMEKVMRQPLSTRAQLSMLMEGLDGDPMPLVRDLNVTTAPFSVERLRVLLTNCEAKSPLTLRWPAGRLNRTIPGSAFFGLLVFAVFGLSAVFQRASDKWMGITVLMGITLACTFLLDSVRSRLRPSVFHVVVGLVSGMGLYGATRGIIAVLPRVWPEWELFARTLYSWKAGHATLFLAATCSMIVLAEELLWRGVVTRFLMERLGSGWGIVAGAIVYTLAHWATFNPLLLLAAFGCGLFWGWLYAAADNLIVPFVSHLLWDVLLLFVSSPLGKVG